jgi:Flp pilus assembly protein TadD
VRQSFAALATLKPGRWGRAERAAATGSPAAEATARGMSLRQQGQFKAAAEAYGQAMAADAQAPAPVLNLAILHDLYLGDRNAALAGYERYLQLQQAAAGSVDNTVQRWVTELKARKPAAPAAPAAVPSQANTSANTAATTPPKAPAKEGS